MSPLCSRCGGIRRQGQRYCLACHAADQRARRQRIPLTPEQRKKDNARSYAGVYKRRGKLAPEPCVECGAADAEMHHESYDQPLAVVWLCRLCHLKHHAA